MSETEAVSSPYIVTATTAARQCCLVLHDELMHAGIQAEYRTLLRPGNMEQFVVDYDPLGALDAVAESAKALAKSIIAFGPLVYFYRLTAPGHQPTMAVWENYGGIGVRGILDYLVHQDKYIGRLDILIGK